MLRTLICLFCVSAATVAMAQDEQNDSPWDLFSSDVGVLIRVHEPDRTIEKVAALAESIQPGMGDLVQQQAQMLGQAISNPEMIGVDQSRDWYAGVYVQQYSPPIIVFAIPAVNADDMVSVLEDEMTTRVEGRWVLYTDAESFPNSSEERASAELNEAFKTAVESSDLTVFVNADRLADVFAEQINLAEDRALEVLNSRRFLLPDMGVDTTVLMNFYSQFLQMFYQGIRDSKALTLAVALDEETVAIDEHLEFKEDSAASRFIANYPPESMPAIRKLPTGAEIYFGLAHTAEWTKWNMELNLALLNPSDVEEEVKDLIGRIGSLDFGPYLSCVDMSRSSGGMFRTGAIVEVSPLDAAKSFLRDSNGQIESFDLPGVTQIITDEIGVEKYGSRDGDLLTIEQAFEDGPGGAGLETRIQELLFGGGTIETRTVWLDDSYVQSTGGGREYMETLLKAVDSEDSQPIEKFSRPLPEESLFMVYIDLPGVIAATLDAVGESGMAPIAIDTATIDSLGIETSYLGVSISSEKNAFTCQTCVPHKLIRGMTQLSLFLGAQFQGGGL